MKKYLKRIIVAFIIILSTTLLAACSVKPVDILAAKAALEIGYANDESASLVKSDLVLPTTIEGFSGLSVSWVSDEPEIVSITGEVTRPTTETVVTLTATLKVLELSENKIFLLTVLAKDELPPIDENEQVVLNKIRADIDALDSIDIVNFMVNAPTSGAINNSLISWSYNSLNINRRGMVIPYNFASKSREATATAKFSLGQYSLEKTYPLTLPDNENTIIDRVKSVPFKNMTTEYNVSDTNFNIYHNQNGVVPYVSVSEFIELLRGLISPSLVFNYEDSDGIFKISYDYFSEDNELYTLTMTLDTINNKITTNDSGFFYGYVEGTETNYSRNILYDNNSSLNHYVASDGHDLDLGKYGFSVIDYEGNALIPLSVANQLFATSNYYSVHYNQDQLTGVFFIPDPESTEGLEMLDSSINGSTIPNDLLIHNFNFLAFFFDNFYGLKEYQNVDTYYNILFARKNNLLSNSAAMVDNEIFILLNNDIDENHTYFGTKSPYQNKDASGPQLTSLAQMGPNNYNYYVNGLMAMDEALGNKWGPIPNGFQSWNAYLPNRLPYWFIDNQTVVITLDGFETANIEESFIWDNEIILDVFDINNFNDPVPGFDDGGNYFYYDNSDYDLSLLEILITDTTSDHVDYYHHLLTDLNGFTYHSATANNNYEFYKSDGYYTKQVNGVDYMIQVVYNEEFKVTYLGIANDIPANFNDEWPFYHDVDLLVESDSAVYLEFYLEKAYQEKPFLEHAILDITWNMGGNIGALYRVLGIMFGSSFSVSSFDPTLGEKSTNVISVDSYYSNLDWYILTSPVSFSAGNMLPSIVRQNNLAPILGQKSGGGAASVTPVYLPIGTIFAASSSNVSAVVSGENTTSSPYVYEINEGGIIPDHIIPLHQIFDEDVLKTIIYG